VNVYFVQYMREYLSKPGSEAEMVERTDKENSRVTQRQSASDFPTSIANHPVNHGSNWEPYHQTPSTVTRHPSPSIIHRSERFDVSLTILGVSMAVIFTSNIIKSG
jgi:hypothetical protein